MIPNTTRSVPGPGRPAAARALAAALAVVVVTAPAFVAGPAGGLAAASAGGSPGPGALTTLTAPQVACTLSSTDIEAGQSVTVAVDPIEDVDGVQYDQYGDGNFGDLTEVFERTFTYEEVGTYQPQVRAWSLSGETDNSTTEVCGELTVTAPFDVAFAYSPESPEAGQTVGFEADVAGDPEGSVEYAWDFTGDGEFVTTAEPTAEHTYAEAGEYAVTLRATDEAGRTATAERVVTVASSGFDVELVYEPESPEVGQTVGFAADVAGDPQGSVQYAWDLTGNGEFETTAEPTIEHTYAEQNDYPVTVRVTDEAGRTATAERVVVVEGVPTATATPEPTATPTPPSTPAEGEVTGAWWYAPLEPRTGEVVTLVASGDAVEGVSYGWDLDGDGSAETTGRIVSHTFEEAGDHEVTLRVTGADREDLLHRQTISVEPNPGTGDSVEGPTFWYTPLDPRAGEMVVLVASPEDPDAVEEFAWDLDGDGAVDQRGPVASYAFEDNGSAPVTLEVHRPDGSVETVGNNVTVELSSNETIRERTTGDDGLVDRLRERVEEIPGFGAPAAVAALVVAAVLARRRRSGG